jgi:hypothetical protein
MIAAGHLVDRKANPGTADKAGDSADFRRSTTGWRA